MCDCNTKNAGGIPIGVLFNRNLAAAQQLFAKYDLSNVPVTLDNALLAAKAKGVGFAKELAATIAGSDATSNLTGDEKANLANTILGTIGAAVGLGAAIAAQAGAFKPGDVPVSTTTPGAPVYTAPPAQPAKQEKRYAGFTVTQLALLGVALVLVVAAIWYVNKD